MKIKLGMIVVVVLVVAIVAMLYLAFVGQSVSGDNIGAKTDPTGQDRTPIAYGVFEVSASVKNVYDGFEGTLVNSVEIFPYIGQESPQTTKFFTLDLLEDEVKVWIETTISGPGNYYISWTSDKIEDTIPELYWNPFDPFSSNDDVHEYDFGPYDAYFYDGGSYTFTSSLWVEWDEGWDAPQKIAQKSDVFTVA